MKKLLFWLLAPAVLFAQEFNYVESPEEASEISLNVRSVNSTVSYNELIIVAVDAGASPTLPTWIYGIPTKAHDFFDAASFGAVDYQATLITKNATQAFVMPTPYVTTFPGNCEHVHLISNINAVFQEADAIYNFGYYDFDNDGKVYIHFTSIGPKGGGVVSQCVTYTTNDVNGAGGAVKLYVNRQTRGVYESVFINVLTHENGHGLFGFPDMEHANINLYSHYSLGGFDVMSCGGFQGVPSLYNPWFRHVKGWYTPTSITASSTNVQLGDFQGTGVGYLYEPALPSNARPNQKFYITYHKPNNYFFSTWPYKNREKGGLLVWHVSSSSISTPYNDWRIMAIDIDGADGKFIWQDYVNTGEANALTGRDNLEIRKIVNNVEVGGPFYGIDKGNSAIFYTPDDGTEFTAFSNPNSNLIVNSSTENYAQSITTGFSIKNIRTQNQQTYADFLLNDYVISKNTTLSKGKWYINGTITVNSSATLTIPVGTTLVFASGASLVVNGVLSAAGAEFIFTGNTGKITLDGSIAASSVLNGIIVRNGSQVECLNGANALIQNCTIENATNGIYVYNSAPQIIGCTILDPYNNGIYGEANGKAPLIKNNVIKKTSHNLNHYQGIYLMNGTTPFITGNDISGFDFGIYYGGGGTGKLADLNSSTPAKNNRFTGNRIGLTVAWGSYMVAGIPTYPYEGANNSIWGNSDYDATAYQNGAIIAYHNWWGDDGTQVYSYSGGSISAGLPLTSDPWPVAAPAPPLETNITTAKSSESSGNLAADPLLLELYEGLKLEESGDIEEAFNHYTQMIENNSNSNFALSSLIKLKNNYGKEEVKDYIENLPSRGLLKDEALYNANNLLAGIYLEEGDVNKAFGIYDEVIRKSNDGYGGLNARFSKFYAALNIMKDERFAENILNDIKSLSITDADFLMREETAEYLLYGATSKQFGIPSAESTSGAEDKVSEYALLGNYPNPFNPTTIISFELPTDSKVSLKVYNLLGQEVAVLVNEVKTAGRYNVSFDASRFATGIYIYELRADNFRAVKKMSFVK